MTLFDEKELVALKDFVPASGYNAMLRLLKAIAAANPQYSQNTGGSSTTRPRPHRDPWDWFLVKTTGSPSGGKHAWREQDNNAGTLEDKQGGRTGTTSDGWAYSVSGSDLAANTVALMLVVINHDGTGSNWLFTGGSLPDLQYQGMILTEVAQHVIGGDFARGVPPVL